MDLDELAVAARTDSAAARRLFAALHRHLLGFLRRRFPSADAEHEDIVQNTLAIVHRKLDLFEPRAPGSILRWARAIAGFEARRVLEKRRRRQGLLMRWRRSPTLETGLSSLLFRGHMRAKLHRELERLPSYQRRALEHELAGGEIDEFAEAEGVSPAAARAVRARARKLVAARVLRRLTRHAVTVGSTPAST